MIRHISEGSIEVLKEPSTSKYQVFTKLSSINDGGIEVLKKTRYYRSMKHFCLIKTEKTIWNFLV